MGGAGSPLAPSGSGTAPEGTRPEGLQCGVSRGERPHRETPDLTAFLCNYTRIAQVRCSV